MPWWRTFSCDGLLVVGYILSFWEKIFNILPVRERNVREIIFGIKYVRVKCFRQKIFGIMPVNLKIRPGQKLTTVPEVEKQKEKKKNKKYRRQVRYHFGHFVFRHSSYQSPFCVDISKNQNMVLRYVNFPEVLLCRLSWLHRTFQSREFSWSTDKMPPKRN